MVIPQYFKLFLYSCLVILFLSFCSRDERKRPTSRILLTDNCFSELGDKVVAISLKKLLKQSKASNLTITQKTVIEELGGLTKILGYIIDQKNGDIFLFGDIKKDIPPINLGDFILSLQNISRKFMQKEGETLYYSYPGCSIDPSGEVMARLNKVSSVFNNDLDSNQLKQLDAQWIEVCESPQAVRVFGIPFNSHFAKIMVAADYDMKTIVDGSDDSLFVDGLKSITEMRLKEIEEELNEDLTSNVAQSSMNRFWFRPGSLKIAVAEDGASICECSVILSTEEEFLNSSGKIKGTGRTNPRADRFAKQFTKYYHEISQQRPIFVELNNLYRLFALAQTLKNISLPGPIAQLVQDLETNYEIPTVSLPSTLPGRSNIEKFQHKTTFENGYSIANYWLPSCGGVNMDLPNPKIKYSKDTKGDLAKLKDAIMGESQKHPDEFSFDLNVNSLRRAASSGTGSFNNPLTNHQYLFKISKNGPNITINDGRNPSKNFSLREEKKIYKHLRKSLSSNTKFVFIELDGYQFRDPKTEAFKENIKLKLKLKNPVLDIRFSGNKNLAREIFGKGIIETSSIKTSEPTRIKNGPQKGWFRTSIDFFIRWKGRVINFTLNVFTKSEPLGSYFREFWESLGNQKNSEKTLPDFLEEAYDNLPQHLYPNNGELFYKINCVEAEIGDMQLSKLEKLKAPKTNQF